jgi:hypothetical protein
MVRTGIQQVMRWFPYFAFSAILRSNVKINKYILKSAEIFSVFSAVTHSKANLIRRGLSLRKTPIPRGLSIMGIFTWFSNVF